MSRLQSREEDAGFELKKNGIWYKFKANLLAGLLILLPLFLTCVILVKIFLFIDGILNRLATRALFATLNLPLDENQVIYGLGILTLFIVVLTAGSVARNVIGRGMLRWFDSWLDRIPVISTIYKTLRQISQTIFSAKGEAFRHPVLIEYPRAGVYCIAFRAQTDTRRINEALSDDFAAVFLPKTPNPATGFLLFLPKSQVIDAPITSEEAIKLIISGGMINQNESIDAANSELPDLN
jgi:uncharacterized membrane protein